MALMQTGPLVRRFTRNPLGRDLIVGDVHGHFTRLRRALEAVGFNPDRDRLFSVGDLVDRGPESDHVLDWLGQPWFEAVSGNHEDYAIRWPRGRWVNGVFERNMHPAQYVAHGGGWNVGLTLCEQQEIAATLAALPVAIELETAGGLVGIVHADCPTPDWAEFVRQLEDPSLSVGARMSLIDRAQWSRDRADHLLSDPVAGVRAVVVGHNPMPAFTSLGNVLFIDTGGWLPEGRNRPFTILDAETLRPADKPSALQW